jgi:Flp pilus assembly pilin Flp
MSELSLRTLTRTQVALRYARHSIRKHAVASARRVGDRFRREQTGQDVLEYAGMIVLVAVVIALLFSLNVPNTVGTAIANAVNAIVSGKSSTYSAPPPVKVPTSP